jgi:hypothetical protein
MFTDHDQFMHLRQTLVPLAVAMHVLSLRKPQIEAMVESGLLQWVFDVSAPSGQVTRQEWRFWLGELLNRRAQEHLTETEAVGRIVGHETERSLSLRTIGELLWVARPHLNRLQSTGELPVKVRGGIKCVERPAFCAFLERRLVR